jgi:hypothetical protein
MAWSHEEKSRVWFKGRQVEGNDGTEWRKDACGAWMGWRFYGDRNSQYGWEIDHINPDGGDALSNLQPLQWENNAAKSDGKLACVTTASGTENAPVSRSRSY